MAIDNTNVPKTRYTAGHDVYNSDLEDQRDNQIIEMLYRVITSNGRFGVIDTKVLGTKLRVTNIGGKTIQISPGFALDGWGKRTGLLVAHNQVISSSYVGKYVCIRAKTIASSPRAHPVTGVNSYTRDTLDTNPLNIISYLISIPPAEVNDWIVLDRIMEIAGDNVILASDTMSASDFAKIRKVFSAQSVWWNQSGPGGTTISPSITDGCTLEEFLACKGSGVRTINNPLGLTIDDVGGTIVQNHLRGSHRTGIHPISDINRNALRPSIVGLTVALYPLVSGEYIQVDNKIYSSSDITSYTVSFVPSEYGQTWTIYFDQNSPSPKKILRSLESTLVSGELKVCYVTLDGVGVITDLVDHYTGSGGPYRQESFFSTKARDIAFTGHILKWFTVGAQETGTVIYDTNTTYDNLPFLNKGIILIPASGGTPQIRTITSVVDGLTPPGAIHESYGVSSPWSPVPNVGDLVGIFDPEKIGYDDLQHVIDYIWDRFNSVSGHTHLGTAGQAPQIPSGGIVDGAILDSKIGNRTVNDSIGSSYSNTGVLTTLLSWFSKRFKEVLGTSTWRDAVPISLTGLFNKFAATSGAGGHTHTGVAGDGPVLTPPPSVGFMAYLNTSFNFTGPGVTSLACEMESFDDGSGYDTGNKWYIVPQNGIYLFNVLAVVSYLGSTHASAVYLRVDGSVVYSLQGNYDVGTQSLINGSKILKLSAGQKVEALVGGYQIQVYGASGGIATSFSGHRVA